MKKNFWDEKIETPSWNRFSDAIKMHIEYLKAQEKQNRQFKCYCKVCRDFIENASTK